MSVRILLSALSLLVAIVGLGCDSEEPISILLPPPPGPPEDPNSPHHAVLRFIWSYENKDLQVFQNLLTGDFEYEISPKVDPALATEFSGGWSRDDETLSAQNLFHGGVNRHGQMMEKASSIELVFQSTSPVDDMTEGRNPEKYKTLLTPVGLVVVQGDDSFIVGQGPNLDRYRIFLVRGDAANGLTEDQPADEDHWYIWRWRDEADGDDTANFDPAPDDAAGSAETAFVSWSHVKGRFR